MNVRVVNAEGKDVGTRAILAGWEVRRVVPVLLQQAVVMARANRRIPWAHAKGRSEVRGGGRKPWRQKGTGRARHGSIRSPLWKGGGSTFGPQKERSYTKHMPLAMRRAALAMSLVSKVRDKELCFLDHFPTVTKTKDLGALLRALGVSRSILLCPPSDQRASMQRSARNIPEGVLVMDPSQLTAADVLSRRHLVVSSESWSVLEQRLLKSHQGRTP